MAGPEKSYNVADVVREARLTKPAIVFDFADKGKFRVDPPELWGDEVVEASSDGKGLEVMRLLLGGDEKVAEFKAAGGSLSVFNLVLAEHTREKDTGKSSASSDS